MYRIELTNDNKTIKKLDSNNFKELYTFMEMYTPELFNYQDNVNDYLITIMLDYYHDTKITDEEKEEYKRLTAYNDALYYSLNDNDDSLSNQLTQKLNNELDTLANDAKTCKYMLEQISLYNLGINFKKVSE